MIDFTVAICTYNGEKRFPEVLERLQTSAQGNTGQISWEVLIIDNNSTDNTAKLVQDYQINWPLAYPLKYFFEPQQGLAFARQRAVIEAKGKFIGFLDDDNLPDSNWIRSAYNFGQAHSLAGAYGGQVHGDFEVAPPHRFERIASFLAIVERGATPFIYKRYQGMLPPGSGLVVRRQAWCENVPSRLFLTGRIGTSMLASEDLEALLYIQKGGWEIWYNPEMQIIHKIPSWRLERNQLLSVVRGIGLARHHIRMLRLESWQKPFAFLLYFINDLRKILCFFGKYKTFFKIELVDACEREFLLSSLISPFYLWGQSLRRKK
jgi:glycosyltransferase involved in cell wall biosynthesis